MIGPGSGGCRFVSLPLPVIILLGVLVMASYGPLWHNNDPLRLIGYEVKYVTGFLCNIP